MPKRHGLYRQLDKSAPWYDIPWFLFGIWDIFRAVAYTGITSGSDERKMARALEYHFRELIPRLCHSLDLFQLSLLDVEKFFNTPVEEFAGNLGIFVNSSVCAESAVSYISMFADDLAKIIPIALEGFVPSDVDSFSGLKAKIRKGSYPVLKLLFDELDSPNSWFELGLKRGVGVRQRIVHYPDIITFQGEQADDGRMNVVSLIMSPEIYEGAKDFISTLKAILANLCEWLDKLEQVLSTQLQSRASSAGILLALQSAMPQPVCARLYLPVNLPLGTRIIPDDFLFLPVCDGSASIGCQSDVTKEDVGSEPAVTEAQG